MSNQCFTCLMKIGELEAELDELFAPDELMLEYFTPFDTKETLPDGSTVTLGGLLLSLPSEVPAPYGFYELVNTFRSWPSDDLMDYMLLRLCMAEKDDLGKGVDGFMTAVDRLLVNPEDKWRLMDAAIHPIDHLEKLRPLVTAVAEHIEKKLPVFEPLFTEADEELKSYKTKLELLNDRLKYGQSEKAADNTDFFMSLYLFNTIFALPTMEHFRNDGASNDAYTRIFLGAAFLFLIKKSREWGASVEEHLYLLKLISDPMRFNVLHDTCDRYTFGLELAEKYKTARGTMYYHLEKLKDIGLIDLKSSDYRLLFTMNKRNVYDKLNALRDYLLNGWRPEDEG